MGMYRNTALIRLSLVIAASALAMRAALPANSSITASASSGQSATFTAVWTDTDGASDINFAYSMIASGAGTTANTCTAVILSSNLIMVLDNSGAFQSGITAGSGSTSSNSQCTLNGTGSSVNRTGNTLTVVFNITFQESYSGAKNLWGFVQDNAAGTDGFDDLGDFTVTGPPADYYVDFTDGSDSNNGLSPATAWKTLNKVQSGTYTPGSRILFQRGERWRGESLDFPSSGANGNPIILDAYGTGAAPIIDGSIVLTGWTQDGATNRWYVTGHTPVTRMVFHDGSFMNRAASVAAMAANTYFHDTGTNRLYVFTPDSSTPTNNTIEASTAPVQSYFGSFMFTDKSYITIRNLDFRKSNGNGILMTSSTLGPSSDHFEIEYNTFANSYANTIQMTGSLGQGLPSYINIRYNTFDTNGLGRGYMGTEPAEGVTINFQGCQHCSAVGNYATDQGGEGIQVMAGASDITIEDNVMDDPYAPGIYVLSGTGNCGDTTFVTVRRNTVIADTNMARSGSSPTLTAISNERCYDSTYTRISGNTLGSTASTFKFANDWQINFLTTGTPPAPLVVGTKYWVVNAGISGQHTFQVASTKGGAPITITSNGTGTQTMQTDPWTTDVEFSYNTVIDKTSGTFGQSLWIGSGVTWGGLRRIKVHNNTLYGSYWGIVGRGATDEASLSFSNNIIVVSGSNPPYGILPTLVSGATNSTANYTQTNYDLFWNIPGTMNASSTIVDWGGSNGRTLAQWQADSVNADNSVIGSPVFTNAGTSDFTLQSTSPAINAGVAVSGILQQRNGSAPDIGRWEFTRGRLGTTLVSTLKNRHKVRVF